MKNIAEALKYQRQLNKLSQTQLAKETNLTQQSIYNWENDINSPKIEYCIILADYYGISLDELVGRDFIAPRTIIYKSNVNNVLGDNSKIEIK